MSYSSAAAAALLVLGLSSCAGAGSIATVARSAGEDALGRRTGSNDSPTTITAADDRAQDPLTAPVPEATRPPAGPAAPVAIRPPAEEVAAFVEVLKGDPRFVGRLPTPSQAYAECTSSALQEYSQALVAGEKPRPWEEWERERCGDRQNLEQKDRAERERREQISREWPTPLAKNGFDDARYYVMKEIAEAYVRLREEHPKGDLPGFEPEMLAALDANREALERFGTFF